MNIFESLIAIALAGLAPILFTFVFRFLVAILTHEIHAVEKSEISNLDTYLKYRGTLIASYSDGRPSDGYHMVFDKGWIVYRTTKTAGRDSHEIASYKIYVVKWFYACDELCNLLTSSKPKTVKTRYIYSPTPYRTEVETLPQHRDFESYKWQTDVAEQLIEDYNRCSRASIILHGKPGLGKTTLGFIVAELLNASPNMVEATLVANFDPTSPGLLLSAAWRSPPSRTRPVVLMLNEYDTIVKFCEADKKQSAREGLSLANSKNSFTSLLDRLSATDNLIVIATMNGNDILNDDKYQPYVRKGRFNINYEVS